MFIKENIKRTIKYTTKTKLVSAYEAEVSRLENIADSRLDQMNKLSDKVVALNVALTTSQKLASKTLRWQTFGGVSLGFNVIFVAILLCL